MLFASPTQEQGIKITLSLWKRSIFYFSFDSGKDRFFLINPCYSLSRLAANLRSLVALSLSRPRTKPSEFFLRKPFLFCNELDTLPRYILVSYCLGQGTYFNNYFLEQGHKYISCCAEQVQGLKYSAAHARRGQVREKQS